MEKKEMKFGNVISEDKRPKDIDSVQDTKRDIVDDKVIIDHFAVLERGECREVQFEKPHDSKSTVQYYMQATPQENWHVSNLLNRLMNLLPGKQFGSFIGTDGQRYIRRWY
jgi:hypothetical protein